MGDLTNPENGTIFDGDKLPGNPPQTSAHNSVGLFLPQARLSSAVVLILHAATWSRARRLTVGGLELILRPLDRIGTARKFVPSELRPKPPSISTKHAQGDVVVEGDMLWPPGLAM